MIGGACVLLAYSLWISLSVSLRRFSAWSDGPAVNVPHMMMCVNLVVVSGNLGVVGRSWWVMLVGSSKSVMRPCMMAIARGGVPS